MRTSAIQTLGKIFGKIFGLTMLALAFAPSLAPSAARAQNFDKDSANAAYASASPASNPMDEPLPDTPLTPEESALLGPALTFDPAATSNAPPKKLRLPSKTIQQGLDIKTTEKPDGVSTMVLKQPLPYDATVGADLGVASGATDPYYRPGRPLPGSRDARSSGAAWASVGVVPNFATIDARVDPTNDQGKLATTFKHAMPIGSNFSMTLRNSYSVTETYSAGPAGPSDLPLMTAPAATAPMPQALNQVWGNEKGAKFDVLPSGTSFGAKLATSSIDPATHNELSAEQKIYGGLNVKTAVTDLGQPTRGKSISAGFKLNW